MTQRAWALARRTLSRDTFDEHVTTHPGEATDITRRALLDGAELIVAVGGDGTLSEVVNGYFDDRGRAINGGASLGLLPSGTGSDFGRSLGISKLEDSVAALIRGETKPVDAASAEFSDLRGKRVKRLFINVASFGLGGEVSALVNRWRDSLPRWIGGRVRFSAAAVAALKRYRNVPVSIRLDGKREIHVSSDLIIVANGVFGGGGMMLAPQARLDDGLLDVIVTDAATRWDVIRELLRIQRGGYLNNPKVTAYRTRELSIQSHEPLPIDLDGEMVGYTPACIKVLPSGISFVTFSAPPTVDP
jgi:YegS/Rv2252/BmrU family lipid kinase